LPAPPPDLTFDLAFDPTLASAWAVRPGLFTPRS
jgi:hypothetical protein